MNFAEVMKWRIPQGNVIKVTDTNNTRVIWSKSKAEEDYNKRLQEEIANADKTVPSGMGGLIIKNISNETAEVTFTTRLGSLFDTYTDDSHTLTLKKNDLTTQTLTFNNETRSIVVSLPAGHCLSATGYTNPQHTALSYVGNQPYVQAKCSKHYVLIGQGNTIRLPFTCSTDDNLIDASSMTWTISASDTYYNVNQKGSYSSLFLGCSNLVYPPSLYYTSNVMNQYVYTSCFENCVNLTQTMTNPVKVPSGPYSTNFCSRMYFSCVMLRNADNAVVFQVGSYTNHYADTTVQRSSGRGQEGRACCASMFASCIRLRSAKFSLPWAQAITYYYVSVLQSSWSARDMYNNMFADCRKLKEPPKLEKLYVQSGTSPGSGGTVNSSWVGNFGVGNYRNIFYKCYNLQKIILVVSTSDAIRWAVPADEYADRGNTSGPNWYISGEGTATKNWLTIGANPYYGLDDEEIQDNQTGTVHYYAGAGKEPINAGNGNQGYLPSGWTLTLGGWYE